MKDFFTDITPITVKHPTIKRSPCQIQSRITTDEPQYTDYKKSISVPIKRKIKRKFSFEHQIDLHGLTYEEAFRQVVMFFSKCQNEGIRNVLVITGGNALRSTVLRSAFVKWCRDLLGEFVVSFSAANLKHGGDGAFYVILKSKKN